MKNKKTVHPSLQAPKSGNGKWGQTTRKKPRRLSTSMGRRQTNHTESGHFLTKDGALLLRFISPWTLVLSSATSCSILLFSTVVSSSACTKQAVFNQWEHGILFFSTSEDMVILFFSVLFNQWGQGDPVLFNQWGPNEIILFNHPEMTVSSWENIKIQELAVLFNHEGQDPIFLETAWFLDLSKEEVQLRDYLLVCVCTVNGVL